MPHSRMVAVLAALLLVATTATATAPLSSEPAGGWTTFRFSTAANSITFALDASLTGQGIFGADLYDIDGELLAHYRVALDGRGGAVSLRLGESAIEIIVPIGTAGGTGGSVSSSSAGLDCRRFDGMVSSSGRVTTTLSECRHLDRIASGVQFHVIQGQGIGELTVSTPDGAEPALIETGDRVFLLTAADFQGTAIQTEGSAELFVASGAEATLPMVRGFVGLVNFFSWDGAGDASLSYTSPAGDRECGHCSVSEAGMPGERSFRADGAAATTQQQFFVGGADAPKPDLTPS